MLKCTQVLNREILSKEEPKRSPVHSWYVFLGYLLIPLAFCPSYKELRVVHMELSSHFIPEYNQLNRKSYESCWSPSEFMAEPDLNPVFHETIRATVVMGAWTPRVKQWTRTSLPSQETLWFAPSMFIGESIKKMDGKEVLFSCWGYHSSTLVYTEASE